MTGNSNEILDVPQCVEDHLDDHRDRPRRKQGVHTARTPASFIAYLEKHALPETEVWADATQQKLVAVINADMGVVDGELTEDYAGWRDHRLHFTVKQTPEWAAWMSLNNKLGPQQTFAEHIENRLVDITSPDSADMLEVAQTFQATIGVNFESSKRLSNGERQLEYRETIESRAGRNGNLEVPERFIITIAPFEGSDPREVHVRLRHRLHEGSLTIGYQLDNPQDIVRAAFDDVRDTIAAGIDAPVYDGVTA